MLLMRNGVLHGCIAMHSAESGSLSPFNTIIEYSGSVAIQGELYPFIVACHFVRERSEYFRENKPANGFSTSCPFYCSVPHVVYTLLQNMTYMVTCFMSADNLH